MFTYFCAVSYEYYAIACDDPAMIDAEQWAEVDSLLAARPERVPAEERVEQVAELDEFATLQLAQHQAHVFAHRQLLARDVVMQVGRSLSGMLL